MMNSQIKVKLYDTPPAPAAFANSSNSSHHDLDKVDMILEAPSHYSDHAPMYMNHRVLGTASVVAITYLLASGGPIGSEPVVASAGPLIGMMGFILYPLIVTIPYSYIIAEMCSAFPEDGGFTVWVMNAFGPFWGFQVGYCSWVSSIFNVALLPGVLVKVMTEFFDISIASATVEYVIKAAIAVVLALPTLVGAHNVSRFCIGLCGFIFLAFLIFTVWAYTVAVDFDDLFEIRHNVTTYNAVTRDVELDGPIAVDWTTYVNAIFWNYDGLVMVSVFGGQVDNPARVYTRAIFFTVLLMMATYIIPMPAGLSSDDVHWSNLSNDSYPLMAKFVGGRGLQALIVLAAMCSTAGTFIAALYAQSYQLSGMAEQTLAPQWLAHKASRYHTPRNAMLLTLVLTLPLLSVTYTDLLPLTNAFSVAVQLLVIATAYTLRVKLPYVPRPTKVPGGRFMVLLFAVPPVAILCYILYHALTFRFTALGIAVGLLPGIAYSSWQAYRQRNATW